MRVACGIDQELAAYRHLICDPVCAETGMFKVMLPTGSAILKHAMPFCESQTGVQTIGTA